MFKTKKILLFVLLFGFFCFTKPTEASINQLGTNEKDEQYISQVFQKLGTG